MLQGCDGAALPADGIPEPCRRSPDHWNQTVEGGLQLVKWFINEAGRIFHPAGTTLGRDEVENICKTIIRTWWRDNSKGSAETSRRYPDADQAEWVLRELVAAGLLKSEFTGGDQPGRPTTRYRLDPQGIVDLMLEPEEKGV